MKLERLQEAEESVRLAASERVAIEIATRHGITLRPLASGDEIGVANVHIHCWRETYAGLIHDAFLDLLPTTFNKRTEFWREVVAQTAKGDGAAVVASAGDAIVGFVSVGPPRGSYFLDSGELFALYLLRSFQKKKVGYLLLCEGLKRLRQLGFRSAFAWVLSGNPAIAFYLRSGAQLSGLSKTVYIDDHCYEEIAVRWESLEAFV